MSALIDIPHGNDHLSNLEIFADLGAATVRYARSDSAPPPSLKTCLFRWSKEQERAQDPGRFARYDAYIGSDPWHQLREVALRRALGRCEECQDGGRGLHVHHLTYQRFGAESPEDVRVLCAECHRLEHDRDPSLPRDRNNRGNQLA